MKPIKISFVSSYAYPLFNPKVKDVFGGSEVQLYQISKELAKDNNFDIYFLTRYILGKNNIREFDNVKVYQLKKYPRVRRRGNFLKATINFFLGLKRINADIYIQRAAGIETFFIAFFCKIFRKKFIYMVACEIDVSGEYEKKNGLKGKLFGIGLKMADLVITQHQTQKELLKKRINKESIIIKSVYDINQIRKKEANHVLWAGRGDELKKPGLFLNLAQKFPKEKFIIICPRAGAFLDLSGKIKKQSENIPNLKFIDYIPFKEIDSYFQKAKVFINTSDYEGFPNTFIQAAKNKIPILSLGVNPDGMLEEYKIGLCADGNFEKMTEQLKILLENKKLWQEMSENAYNYAKENHDIKKIIKEHKKTLYSLIGKRRGSN